MTLRVSCALSAVYVRYLSGSDNLAIVRHAFAYCTRNGPEVYGRSYLSHSSRTRSDTADSRLLGRSGNR
ncbi:Uncharacterised protein [Mycobacteroides abscessus subsp. abscessus]|nr:Uncharacterised protein [Mycobacteroides abscessus subsp. abscessus]